MVGEIVCVGPHALQRDGAAICSSAPRAERGRYPFRLLCYPGKTSEAPRDCLVSCDRRLTLHAKGGAVQLYDFISGR